MRTIIKNMLPNLISPPRVFIALIVIVILYLLPVYIRSEKQKATGIFVESAEASNRYLCDSRVCGQCCNHGSCVKCPEDGEDPPPPSPPTVSASVECDLWGGGGWCRNNARLAVMASDPQGYPLSISGANPSFSCAGSCTVNLPSGNSATSYTATASTSGLTATGSTSWAYDPNPPTANMVISGTSGSNGWYMSPVTVTASASDLLSGLASAAVSKGGAWSSSISVTDGSYTFNVTASDVAGNTAIGSPQNIQVDTIAPSISVSTTEVLNAIGWYNSNITLSALGFDATSGVNGTVQVSIDDGTTWGNTPINLSAGIYGAQFQASDIAGNKATKQQTIRIDTAPPAIAVTSSGTEGREGWYVSAATLKATTSDDLSGVAYTQYRVNGGTWTDGNSVTLADGVYIVDFQAFDLAGNITTNQQTVRIDTESPSTAVTTSGTERSAGWYISPATLTITSSDNLSDVAGTQHRVNGGEWTNGNSVTLTDGISSVDFLVLDVAGNSTQVSRSTSVDTVPPVLNHSIAGTVGNSPWYTSSITITSSPSDLTSGIESTEYSVDGGVWQAGEIITAGDGIHNIGLRAKDKAGNETQYSITASIDATPPIASITSPSDGAIVANTVFLSGVLSGGLSGVESVQLSIDASPWIEVDHWTETSWDHRWITGYDMNGSHTIRLLVTNNAGNTSEDSITVAVENKLPFIFWATPVPTSTLLPSPTPTIVPTFTLSEPTAEVSVAPSQWSGPQTIATEAPTEQPQRKIVRKGVVSAWKLYIVAAGLFAVFGLTSALDRRPSAYRKTAEILLGIMKNNSQQELKKWIL